MGKLQYSDYRIRKLINILSLLFPFGVSIATNNFLFSINHSYYLALPLLIFIIALSAMVLLLISY